MAAYQRFMWYRLGRLNNRTHRELLVVDGTVAFAGGAGVADWWARPHARQADVARHDGAHRRPGGRRTFRACCAENWLECCGEIMTGPETYKPHIRSGDVAGFSVKSSPSDRSTASRALFQTLVEGGRPTA